MTTGGVNWRRRLAIAAVAALAFLSFAGLRAAAGQSATEPSATASRAVTERIVGLSYRPTPLRVRPGTRVVFSNRSRISHTATQNGRGFDTGRIRPGKAVSVTFKRRGIYRFHCTLHPSMKGKIVVK